VTPSIYGSAAGLGSQEIRSKTERDIQGLKAITGGMQQYGNYGAQDGKMATEAAASAGAAFMSDRESKDVVAPYSPQEGLEAVMQMPISRYYYKGDGEAHVGGMAQDMPPEVLTNDGQAVSVQDQLGVLTSAIQQLYHELQEQKGQAAASPMGRMMYG